MSSGMIDHQHDQFGCQIVDPAGAPLGRTSRFLVALEFRRLGDPLARSLAAPIQECADGGDIPLAARQAVAALALVDKGLPFGGADRGELALTEFGVDLADRCNLAMAYWPACGRRSQRSHAIAVAIDGLTPWTTSSRISRSIVARSASAYSRFSGVAGNSVLLRMRRLFPATRRVPRMCQ
jgi:hypothetical protein